MASYSIVSYSSTSVSFLATGLTVGAQIRFFVRLASVSSDISGDDILTVTSSEMYHHIYGLQPGTAYACNVEHPYIPGEDHWLGRLDFTTKSANTRPYNWSWYSTIVSGGDIGLSALEWTNFCARINEFRVYKDLDEYSFTPVSRGTAISAALVNEAWNAINSIPGHGTMPSAAMQNNPLYASFFTGLTSALNSIT